MPIALLALTISAFAIGTTEFVIVGLLPTVAADLHISLPSAGLLVSLYALGVAIGAPLLTALTGKLPRKTLLLGLMALFTLGNLLAWQAPGYNSLIAARILTGVPLGTFIGQHFGWRETFLAVSALGAIAFVVSLLFVPRSIRHTPPASVSQQLKVLAQPRLLLVYATTAVGYGGSFIPFTFLAPILQQSGFGAGAIGWVMLVYGVSVAAGNIWGGKLADRRGPIAALKIIFALLAAVLLVFNFTAPHPWLAVATVMLWGAVAFGNVPGLQVYVVRQAERHTPHAVDVASGLNIAAFNLGIAFAAWAGGLVVTHLGLMHTPWIGAVVVLGALALTYWSGRLDVREGFASRAAGNSPVVAH